METHILKKLRAKRIVLRNIIVDNEEKPLVQLFFLRDDEDRSVEVEEIEYGEVERRLKQGESVFVTCNRKQELNTSLVAREKTQKNPVTFLTSKEANVRCRM